MPISPDSCADPSDTLLSVEAGRQRILESLAPIEAEERVSLRAALQRVLARDEVSAIDVPPFANSAMDGYAVRSADFAGPARDTFTVIGECFAGAPFAGRLEPGHCVRIMTGAMVPQGADAVIMQEHAERDGGQVRFSASARCGENVRYAGEDTRQGQQVLAAGTRLGAAEIGLLASVGVAEVSVKRRLQAAFFSTGDELTAIGTPLGPGQIYDSNRYTLHALLSMAGLEIHDLGVVRDDRQAVRAALQQAGDIADIVLTSGGVSVGEADYVTQTLNELGEVTFWRMAMKPGKPLAFGRIGGACFFGLPGNPVSVMATFYQFVLPAIHRLYGEAPEQPLLVAARAAEAFGKAPGRMEFQRGIMRRDETGDWQVSNAGGQGSHVLSAMSRANCFVLLDAQSAGAEAGDRVIVQPLVSLV